MAVQEFKKEFIERNPTTPNPLKFQALLEKERGVTALAFAEGAAPEPQIKSLAVPVEFPNSDTFMYSAADPNTGECVDFEVTMNGPLHNEIAPRKG
jgi:hypothetical protein